MCYKYLKDIHKYKQEIVKAKKLSEEDYVLKDPYTHHYDKVYLSQIIKEIDLSKEF